MENIDYYKVLQVDPGAEREVIAAAYKRLSLKYHPDTNKEPDASQRMTEINLAYEILGNPEKRVAYDRERTEAKAREEAEVRARDEANTRTRPTSATGTSRKPKARSEADARARTKSGVSARRKSKYYALSILFIIVILGIIIIFSVDVTNNNETVWDVTWATLQYLSNGSMRDVVLGTSKFPATFHYDWGNGSIYNDLTLVAFSANASIYVHGSNNEAVTFTVDANSGDLWVDNKQVLTLIATSSNINRQNIGTTTIDLTPGKHNLMLRYQHWGPFSGSAHVSFDCNEDVLEW
jgi:hypothetical protein